MNMLWVARGAQPVGLGGKKLTEDDYPVLVTWDGCADRLVSATGASASERSG
ncbi:hypothetical protein [Streptomyces roseicoloratus]|uniref:hypothetical protein n=1 Tax=Streptomyces roseicoloratus TaxID=2508722 RepID=UPI0013E9583F|nr:hypothetical protein [Streptomyces roseicoloratus]